MGLYGPTSGLGLVALATVLSSKCGGVELGAIAIETDVLQDETSACCDHPL